MQSKQNIKNILKTKYGFEEEDFLSAELEVVPAGKARTAGLDESMIFAYGDVCLACCYLYSSEHGAHSSGNSCQCTDGKTFHQQGGKGWLVGGDNMRKGFAFVAIVTGIVYAVRFLICWAGTKGYEPLEHLAVISN